MKRKLLIAAGLLFIFILAVSAFFINGLSAGTNVTLDGVNLVDIPDGSYVGTYNFKRWSNAVMVHVSNHKITAIETEKDMLIPVPDCSAQIFYRVITSQDTMVDAISGATVSSNAYLKAVEDALD